MHTTLRHRTQRVQLAIAAALVLIGLNAEGADGEAAKALNLVKTRGLKGFVAEVKAGTAQGAPQAILSSKSCDRITDPVRRRQVQQERALGKALLSEMVALKGATPGTELSAVEQLEIIRSWSLSQQSYGNLILASVAEDAAVTLLLRLLADPMNDTTKVRAHAEALFRGGPSTDYWVRMLEQEEDPVRIATTNTSPEYLKLAVLFETLQNEKATRQKNAVYPGSGGDYESCFAAYDPAQVGWLYNTLCIRKAALEACLAVKEKMGHIPEARDEFRSALKKNATAVMKKEDRLGGRIDTGQVWIIWCDALSK